MLRAMYEWIADNDLTPHIIVAADYPGVVVPMEYVEENRIVLNISTSATQGLVMGNEEVTFSGRFSGQSISLVVPVGSVVGIYARENGQGMVFEEVVPNSSGDSPDDDPDPDNPPKPQKPSLRIVK